MKKTFKTISLLLIIFLMQCSSVNDSSPVNKYITQKIDPLNINISNPYERWQAYNLENYIFNYASNCFCLWGGKEFKVVVRDGKLFDVFDPEGIIMVDTSRYDWFSTIDQLFEFTYSINPDSVAFFVQEFDSLYGYPSNVYVDYNVQMADEEFGFWVNSLEKIIKFN